MSTSVIRNITWLGAGNAVVKPLWFVFITAVSAQMLGLAQYGVVNASLALVGIVLSLSNVGSSQFSIREVARDRSRATEYLSNFLPFRLGAGSVAMLVALLIGLGLGHRGGDLAALAFAAVYALALNLTEYCRALYRAFERFRYEAVSIIFEKILVISFGTALLFFHPRAAWILAGMAIGMVLALVGNLIWVYSRLARIDFESLSFRFFRKTLPQSFPLGLASIFVVLYLRTDSIMLEAMSGEVAAGLYGLAFRILEAMILLPAVVVAAFLPRLSALFGSQATTDFRRLLSRGLVGLAGLGVMLAVLVTLTAHIIIPLLDPDPSAQPAVAVLRILIWTFPFSAVNYLLSTSMTAADDQKALAWMLGGAAAFNIALNGLLIPHFSYYGASFATLATQVAITSAMFVRHLRRKQQDETDRPNLAPNHVFDLRENT